MAVVVENGTIVAGANSFVSVADANAYLTARGITAFGDADSGDQAAALIRACDYLRDEMLFVYRGQRLTYNQPLPWPRQGASFFRGPLIPNNVVPKNLADAQCELCYKALSGTDLQPDIEHAGGVAEETIGELTTRYFDNTNPRVLITAVMGLLKPLVVAVGPIGLLPTVYHSDALSLNEEFPFGPTDFRSPSLTNPLTES